ncbi:hypothetical protein HPB48_000399 [Haemaphysalis longicornis]|uniref:Uncharacterized protein n=1 Tax=Haemaphysalis longicornis TaxID=44386 RepID=A0A9J6GC42_HAELO|nr:hypothetical protein HPB48_000399 [Haemaphysalis longicornis]
MVLRKSWLLMQKDDWALAKLLLSKVNAIVPSQLLLNVSREPSTSANFHVNVLRHRQWHLLTMLSHDFEGIPVMMSAQRAFYDQSVVSGGKTIVVSKFVIATLNSHNRSLTLESAAAVGASVADLLWHMIFEYQGWPQETRARLQALKSCANPLGLPSFGLRYASLSLQTAAWAAVDQDWHDLKYAWSLWRSSESQLFFMLYTYFWACSSPAIYDFHEIDIAHIRETMPFVTNTPDFKKAYSCSVPDNDSCAAIIGAFPRYYGNTTSLQ